MEPITCSRCGVVLTGTKNAIVTPYRATWDYPVGVVVNFGKFLSTGELIMERAAVAFHCEECLGKAVTHVVERTSEGKTVLHPVSELRRYAESESQMPKQSLN
jgi:hypothetical protein